MITQFTSKRYTGLVVVVLESFMNAAINALDESSAFPEQTLMGLSKHLPGVRHMHVPVGVARCALNNLIPTFNILPVCGPFKSSRRTTNQAILSSPPMAILLTHVTG